MGYFFKILQIMGIVTTWSGQAMADGKITVTEAVSLAVQIAQVLGIPTEIVIPD